MNKHLIGAPVTAALVLLVAKQLMPFAAAYTLALIVWVAWWWISEVLPLAITALLPMVLLPLGGVLPMRSASAALGNDIIILFMGAFMLAKAVEASQVHKRIALNLIQRIGASDGKRVVFAFMLATAFISMWISNTAAVLALLPVALAISDASENKNFQRALLLGLAYAASVGGIGTLIGTPPNLIFASVYEQSTGASFGFSRWLSIGIPLVVIAIPLMAWWLSRRVQLTQPLVLPELGDMSHYERRVLWVFGAVVAAWVLRTAPFGGWSAWLQLPEVSDATVALAGVVAMFMIPSRPQVADAPAPPRLLTWTLAGNIPWSILLLFAGGIALAQGVTASGLSTVLGQALAGLAVLPLWLLVFCLTLSVSLLTEVTSNTATATLLMPILAALSEALQLPPEVLMIPAVIACSCAFCLPVATPPNSIVFSSERVTVREMVREGMALNVMLAVITTGLVMLLIVE